MIVSVASGKGGTGKTTIATSLAAVLGSRAQLLDCDVEEPNCHILVKPTLQTSESITVAVPVVDTAKCTLCGKCGEVCRFSAIIVIGEQVLTFPELCHGCGGCSLLCPEKAISEGTRELGVVETGWAGPVAFVQGRLRVGEAMSPPLIRAVKGKIDDRKIAILDAPPGASCPVIHTVMGSDFLILVTEPTPFGLHDLGIAVDAISGLEIPLGVILNRSDVGDGKVQEFCRHRGIPLLAEIPHDRGIAEGYARGNLLVDSAPQVPDAVPRALRKDHRVDQRTHINFQGNTIVKELVIISGKGGTGKTSLTASFAFLARDKVLADCDVDAADLHILAHPKNILEEDFRGGVKARIDPRKCTQCGVCRDTCRFGAISDEPAVKRLSCEGCGVCAHVCPEQAICLEEGLNGHWFISETRLGPMVHAALLPGEENSGRLVALVRNQAKVLARQQEKSLILVDGAPGVGCPVISSITGADLVLIVTEPTLSGLHDMKRAIELVRGFRMPFAVVVNKHDVNPDVAEQIEQAAVQAQGKVLGRIPYDPQVIRSMVQRHCVVEDGDSPAGRAVREIWSRLEPDLVC